jgi:hypothetical protein
VAVGQCGSGAVGSLAERGCLLLIINVTVCLLNREIYFNIENRLLKKMTLKISKIKYVEKNTLLSLPFLTDLKV